MTDTTKNRQRVDKDGVIHVQLPEVVIEAKDLLAERLLRVPDEYYYHNTRYWCDAIKYMRDTKNIEGERAIFMKRFNYGRAQWAKGTFLLMGGVLAVGFSVALLSSGGAIIIAGKTLAAGRTAYGVVSAGAYELGWAARMAIAKYGYTAAGQVKLFWNAYKAVAGARMITNAAVQAGLSPKGVRDVEVISVLAETLPGGNSIWTKIAYWVAGTTTPIIEYKPFQDREKLKIIGYNKTQSEVIFDINLGIFSSAAFSRLPEGLDIISTQTSSKLIKENLYEK